MDRSPRAHLLVVDDSPFQRDFISASLRESGFEVTTADKTRDERRDDPRMLGTRLAERQQRRLRRVERREVGAGDGLRLEALVRKEPGGRQLLSAPIEADPVRHATARPSARARMSSGSAASSRARSATGTAEITASFW